jgi:hypothetical protein
MKFRIAAMLPLGLAACAQLDPLPAGTEDAVPVSVLSRAPAAPTVSYGGYQVTEPADWRGVNDAQAGS